MAVTTGTTGVDATPATTLYNLLATAMTANGNWTEQSDSPLAAATAGTTDIVRIWKCTGGAANFYVFIEVDNTNLRLRFRLAETWSTATHRLQQPAGGGTAASVTDATSMTPTANGTVVDADTTIGSTNPNVSWSQVNVLGTAFNYLFEVRSNLITVGSKVAGSNFYAIAGCFTSLVTAISDSRPLVLLGHPVNNGLSGTAGSAAGSNSGRFTRVPGFGAAALTGVFCAAACPLVLNLGNNAGTGQINALSAIAGAASNPWFPNHVVCPVIIHGFTSGVPGPQRGLRGFLPDFIAGYFTTEPLLTDTVTIGGVTYIPLGRCVHTPGQSAYIAIKS